MGNLDNLSPEEKKAMDAERRAAWRKARLKSLENDAIQAQLVIQKMSELPTQESSDDLDPISESPSKTLDDEDDEHESSSENDETLEDDDDVVPEDATVDNNVNANLDFRSSTADVENNIPEPSEDLISQELTNPPEAIREEVVETQHSNPVENVVTTGTGNNQNIISESVDVVVADDEKFRE